MLLLLFLSHAATLLISYTAIKLIIHLFVFAHTSLFDLAELPFLVLSHSLVSLSRLI